VRAIDVEEFLVRLRRLLGRDGLVAFFLGAGASISSGIPGAATLTVRWVRELHRMESSGRREPFDRWCAAHCPEYDMANPARSYAAVMRRLFPTRAERQQEIERVVAGHDPGFAYATLAQLLTHDALGERCNVVLTTNFDDLVADALYVFTRSRPLVVSHEALVSYAAFGRRRPTILKLHGDAMLEPRNTADEVAELAPGFVESLRQHLRSRALVVIGYGGNDRGVFTALSALPHDTVTHGIYWVSDQLPDNDFGTWLQEQPEAFHVRHLDFDALMAIAKAEFKLPNPDASRFTNLMQLYRSTFVSLQDKVRTDQAPPITAHSIASVDRSMREELTAPPSLGPAELYLRSGQAPLSGPQQVADLLRKAHRTYHEAQALLQEAIDIEPDKARALGAYATYLVDVLRNLDRSLVLFEQALARARRFSDPSQRIDFMDGAGRIFDDYLQDKDRTDEFFELAMATGQHHADVLTRILNLMYRTRNLPEWSHHKFVLPLAVDRGPGADDD